MKIAQMIVLFGVTVFVSGCASVYVDPQYRNAAYKDIQYTNNPPLVEVSARFEFNGSHWPSQDTKLLQCLTRFLKATKVFEPAGVNEQFKSCRSDHFFFTEYFRFIHKISFAG